MLHNRLRNGRRHDSARCRHGYSGRTMEFPILRVFASSNVFWNPNMGNPLHNACQHGDLYLCELLLKHGANPNLRRERDGKQPKNLLPAFLLGKFKKLTRTKYCPPKCWCLLGKLLSEFHDDPDGVEVESSFGCPCGSAKLYGICCQKRGIRFTETREEYLKHFRD
jgi:hypothetical protein